MNETSKPGDDGAGGGFSLRAFAMQVAAVLGVMAIIMVAAFWERLAPSQTTQNAESPSAPSSEQRAPVDPPQPAPAEGETVVAELRLPSAVVGEAVRDFLKRRGPAPDLPPPPEASGEPRAVPPDPILPELPSDAELFGLPGELLPGSGRGVVDDTIYAAGIRFALETSPAFSNSQVWGKGGVEGEGGLDGDECYAGNYTYPWRDNFCEERDRSASLCPSGRGHQGQDIRPATCEKDKHWAVAVESGQVAHVGVYTVTLVGASGREYRYMHLNMDRLAVKKGDRVLRGDRIGLVSNYFGGTWTTVHLHFEIRQVMRDAEGRITKRFVPPYTSLINAYRRLLISESAARMAATVSERFSLSEPVSAPQETQTETQTETLEKTGERTPAEPAAAPNAPQIPRILP